MPSLTQTLSCPQGTQPPHWMTETRSKISLHNLQGNDQQPETPLRHTQVSGAEWDQPEGSEDAGGSSQEALFIIYQQSWLVNEPSWVEVSKCDPFTIYKKGQKKNPRSYRPVSLTLGTVLEQVILRAVMWQSMCKITVGSDPDSMALWKAVPVWPTWSPSMTRWPTQWKWKSLWILSIWTLIKPLTLFSTAFSWKSWLLVAWVNVSLTGLRTGWMAGPKYLWLLELHPADVQLLVRLPRAQLKSYLHSLSIIWMRR